MPVVRLDQCNVAGAAIQEDVMENSGSWGIVVLGLLFSIVGWMIGGAIAGATGTIVGVLVSVPVFGIMVYVYARLRYPL